MFLGNGSACGHVNLITIQRIWGLVLEGVTVGGGTHKLPDSCLLSAETVSACSEPLQQLLPESSVQVYFYVLFWGHNCSQDSALKACKLRIEFPPADQSQGPKGLNSLSSFTQRGSSRQGNLGSHGFALCCFQLHHGSSGVTVSVLTDFLRSKNWSHLWCFHGSLKLFHVD